MNHSTARVLPFGRSRLHTIPDITRYTITDPLGPLALHLARKTHQLLQSLMSFKLALPNVSGCANPAAQNPSAYRTLSFDFDGVAHITDCLGCPAVARPPKRIPSKLRLNRSFSVQKLRGGRVQPPTMAWLRVEFRLLVSRLLPFPSSGYSVLPQSSRSGRAVSFAQSPRAACRCLTLLVRIGLVVLLCNIILTPIFWPSYTHLPPCYENLQTIASNSDTPGRGNTHNEKVFIAAILYDRTGELAGGPWGDALVQLIDLLGPDNVFLSLYENNSGPKGQQALEALAQRIQSNKSIVVDVDKHTAFDAFPRVTLPDGHKRIKRIDYLATLRNRALRPLDEPNHLTYDKLLYLNDVYFHPVDALQLLFCTNAHPPRTAPAYRAACAVDFSNPFKFYDSYATRDLAGYGIGLPFFPWFTSAGHGRSREDVLAGRDAVRVRSCWGGMVAFDASYFQRANPVRFRADDEVFWDASECCLVHADVQDAPEDVDAIPATGVYMNPFVRVAYTTRTLAWLGTTRRFEGLYVRVHDLLNRAVGLPRENPRRTEVPGSKVKREVWVPEEGLQNGGSFRLVEVTAGNDGFCGRRGMEVVVEDRRPGQDGFEAVPLPSR